MGQDRGAGPRGRWPNPVAFWPGRGLGGHFVTGAQGPQNYARMLKKVMAEAA